MHLGSSGRNTLSRMSTGNHAEELAAQAAQAVRRTVAEAEAKADAEEEETDNAQA